MSLQGLLVDYGGVLTTNVFESFRAFSVSRGLEPNAVKDLFRSQPRARELVRGLETGALTDDEFNDGFGALLELEDRGAIVADLFGHAGPDEAMIAAVRATRAQGIRTGLISNSMGSGIYDRAMLDELFDGVTISGDVGMHKPQPEIYRLAAERIDVPVEQCVIVDDLRENCAGAEAVGMTAILHRGAETTLPRLEELLSVELTAS
ncbi:MAG TPA: HAD family phosphatase [Thermoleophilaceae bacterium]